ncbi:hypothetical protein AGMMS50239_37190 [Bacteroidia bacterium]|nr:hypothetical protein AGMMS50239_37190 [Bacteroidia bacterium]
MNNNCITRREMLARLTMAPALLLAFRTDLMANGYEKKKKWVRLFDGKSLNGWHTNQQKIGHGTGGRWQVENGTLTGEQDPPGSGNGGILMSDKKYGDFELEVELAPDWGVDSGVFIRCNDRGECFQIYVDYHDQGHVAYISTEEKDRMYIRPFFINRILDANGRLTGFETKPDPRKEAWGEGFLRYNCSPEEWKKAWKIGRWNTLRIRCTGKYPRITTWINGVMIADFDGETCASPLYKKEELAEKLGREGHIAFQVHGGKGSWTEGAKCRWRNIRVKS